MRTGRPLPSIAVPLVIGLIALNQTLSRPRLSVVRYVDILSLIGAGMCFGVALTSLLVALRARNPNR